MSDLAPFVAAAIKNKVVHDMRKEIGGLKLQLSRMQEIEVTGPNGTPVGVREVCEIHIIF
jgi:hypothetical protein